MSIAPGWTADEVREFVYEYERQPHGTKSAWLAEQGVTRPRLGRFRAAVFDGDVDRGLVPRDRGTVTPPSTRRQIVKNAADREIEVDRLQARVRELEASNEVLGKAIGLLHAMRVDEPAQPPTPSTPSSS